MKTETLFKLTTMLNGVNSSRWEMVRKIVDYISKGSVDIKEKEWQGDFKKKYVKDYPLDLSKIDTWSTYEECVELRFFVEMKKLKCAVKIYDGDSFGGNRRNLRFTALLWMPNEFIHEIENNINWDFESYLEDAYENHLEAQKKLWINNMKAEILNH